MNNKKYIEIDPTVLRKPYVTEKDPVPGRLPLKLSLTYKLWKNLEKIGVIETYRSKSKYNAGALVAKRGGYGSAFAETAMDLLLSLMGYEEEVIWKVAHFVVDSIMSVEDAERFSNNAHEFALTVQMLVNRKKDKNTPYEES